MTAIGEDALAATARSIHATVVAKGSGAVASAGFANHPTVIADGNGADCLLACESDEEVRAGAAEDAVVPRVTSAPWVGRCPKLRKVEVEPGGDVVWEMTFGTAEQPITTYRAERIASLYEGPLWAY